MRVIGGAGALLLLLLLPNGGEAGWGGPPALQEEGAPPDSIRGVVYLDVEGTGTRDPGDPPVPGALVSNQHQVVVTDEAGRWALPALPEMVTFVVAPPGYQVPVDSLNLPVFHHVHRPDGSPTMRYEGVPATGPLPELVEFGLIRGLDRGEGPIRTAMLADPQTTDHRELGWYRDRILTPLAGEEGIAAAFVLGDIMNDDLSLLPRYTRLSAATGIPTFHLVGNHDLNFDAPAPRYATETFIRWFGPTWYAVRLGGAVFMALNNVDYEGTGYDERGRYRGHLGQDQLAWVEALLAHVPPEDPVVVMAHIPFAFFGADNPGVTTDDRGELFRLLEGRANVLFLSGHTHSTAHQLLGPADGWYGERSVQHLNVTAASGGWWRGPPAADGIPMATQRDGTPHGYHLLEVSNEGFQERLVAQGPEAGRQLRLSSPETGGHGGGETGSGTGEFGLTMDEPLVVNVFNAGADTRVQVRVDGGPWADLAWVPGSDPFFVRQLERFPESFGNRLESLSSPVMQLSTHRWIGPSLEALLEEVGQEADLPRTVRIEVRATRPDGSVYSDVALRELGWAAEPIELSTP